MRILGLELTARDRPETVPVVLYTPRVMLRPPRMTDFSVWADLRGASAEFLRPWEPRWPDDHLGRRSFRRRVRWAHEEAVADRTYSFLALTKGDERLVGGITLSNIRRGPARTATLGYWLGADETGKGYMTEIVERVCRFAFATLRLVRVEAACLEENAPSRRLLARCGFREEGVARGYLEVDAALRDHIIHARLFTDESPLQDVSRTW